MLPEPSNEVPFTVLIFVPDTRVACASVIPYPEIVVGVLVIVDQAWLCAAGVNVDGTPVKEPYAPSKASVIPYPAIVVGVPVKELNAPSKFAVLSGPDPPIPE